MKAAILKEIPEAQVEFLVGEGGEWTTDNTIRSRREKVCVYRQAALGIFATSIGYYFYRQLQFEVCLKAHLE